MTDCIIFQGFVADNGYGRRWSRSTKKMSSAHRVAWEEAHGPIPPGRVIMHSCDVRTCVNLNHLYLGTQQENIQDMVAKRRRRFDREHNPRHKLTEAQVEEIRSDHRTLRSIAADYDVHHSTINAIKRGRTWQAASM
jgi:hypothetical protein